MERRGLYRIYYPAHKMARLVVDRKFYNVLDLSESYLRIRPYIDSYFESNQNIYGDLILLHGYRSKIVAKPFRWQGDDLILKLDRPISYRAITDEQLFMKRQNIK